MKSVLLALLAACQPGTALAPTPLAPQSPDDATFKMLTGDAMGTAWAVSEHYLVTAGHMCDTTDTYAMVSSKGERFAATLVDFAQVYPAGDTAPYIPEDICLVKTERTLSVHLNLAQEMPAVGTPVWYVGYPLGQWAKSYGVYQGDLDADQHWNDYSFSSPCDHGASGSAVLDADGVWGVLVRVKVEVEDGEAHVLSGTQGCVATPLSAILDILSKA